MSQTRLSTKLGSLDNAMVRALAVIITMTTATSQVPALAGTATGGSLIAYRQDSSRIGSSLLLALAHGQAPFLAPLNGVASLA